MPGAAAATPRDDNDGPLFFWRETESEGGFLSPWYISPFSEYGHTYESVGHYVMASKADYFKDEETLKKIYATKDPDQQRALASKIKNFDERIWKTASYRIAVRANLAKFSKFKQAADPTSDLTDCLLNTGERELVDASPHDRVWGIGFKAADAKKKSVSRDQWGENQFGKALMEARTKIRTNWSPTAVFDDPTSKFFVEW